MAPLLASLASWGLPLIADAVKAKGKEFVEEKLGITLSPDMSSEQITAARNAEIAHEQWLVEAGQKAFDSEVIDRADARKMQAVALAQDDIFSKRFVPYLAVAMLTFTGFYILWITFGTIPAANVRFADTILGFLLGTVVSTIVYFFFGTSRSSQSKDVTIQALTKQV